MTSKKLTIRPYTSPLVQNPTYPTVIGNHIREMSWREPEVIPMGFDTWEEYALDEKRRRQDAQRELERYKGLLARSRIDLMKEINGIQLPIPDSYVLIKTYQDDNDIVEIWTNGQSYIYRSGYYFKGSDDIRWFNQSSPCKVVNLI